MAACFVVGANEPFPDKGPGREVFYDQGALKVQSISLRAGQAIPPCAMDYDVVFYVIRGAGTVRVDSESFELRPGVGVVAPKEAAQRSMESTEDLVVLAVQGRPERNAEP